MQGFGFFDGGLFLVFWIIPVVFWVGLIALIFLGIRWLIRQNATDRSRIAQPPEDTALELLRQRYARGEIDAAEYEERRRTLGQ
ncbi:MAG: putative rane protein [Chloroflexota bacterium]|nr:putative rane protein [Chloroflexota bacterium]